MYRTPAVLGKGEATLAAKEVVAEAGFEGGRRARLGVEVWQISFLAGRPEFEYPALPLAFGANSELRRAGFLIPEGEQG